MRARSAVVLGIGAFALGFTAWQMVSSASASSAVTAQRLTPSLMALTPAAKEAEEPAYAGSATCRMCHIGQFRSWSGGVHARAFESLKPGERVEAKRAHGLDPNKDYTSDASCLKCHVTGFGRRGGFDNDGSESHNQNFMQVGCESCHGPGGAYIGLHEEIMRSRRMYKVDEMHAAGMNRIDLNTCRECHNEQSPTFDASRAFEFEEAVKVGVHERGELRQRAD